MNSKQDQCGDTPDYEFLHRSAKQGIICFNPEGMIISANPAAETMLGIAMTAYAMKGDREAYLAAGMEQYTSKPIKPSILYTVPAKAVSSEEALKTEQQPASAASSKISLTRTTLSRFSSNLKRRFSPWKHTILARLDPSNNGINNESISNMGKSYESKINQRST